MEIQYLVKVKYENGIIAYLHCSEKDRYWVDSQTKATKFTYPVAKAFCSLYSEIDDYTGESEKQYSIFAHYEEFVN